MTHKTLAEQVEDLRENSRRVVRELGLLNGQYKDCGLTLSECHLLFEMLKSPYASVGTLAGQMNLDKSTTSRLVAKLAKKKLISYVADPADKRRRTLSMTKKGHELAEKINSLAHLQVHNALESLREEEKNCVVRGMSLYSQALRKSRIKEEISIRELLPEESAELSRVLLDVLTEYGCNKPGYAAKDREMHELYKAYKQPGCKYFVAHIGNKVVGGAGIAPLIKGDGKTCELRKMYLLKEARGLGIGSMLLKKCLEEAKKLGYSFCYLETTSSMSKAHQLYLKHGFKEIKERKGNTGHWACDKFFEKRL